MRSLAGNGLSGYADGDLASAKFDKPKSFAIDLKGNIYVADNHNHAIRKISKSGRYINYLFGRHYTILLAHKHLSKTI